MHKTHAECTKYKELSQTDAAAAALEPPLADALAAALGRALAAGLPAPQVQQQPRQGSRRRRRGGSDDEVSGGGGAGGGAAGGGAGTSTPGANSGPPAGTHASSAVTGAAGAEDGAGGGWSREEDAALVLAHREQVAALAARGLPPRAALGGPGPWLELAEAPALRHRGVHGVWRRWSRRLSAYTLQRYEVRRPARSRARSRAWWFVCGCQCQCSCSRPTVYRPATSCSGLACISFLPKACCPIDSQGFGFHEKLCCHAVA
eukprot:365474-Chlamydomonas_euryale.AAC.3